MTSPDTVEVLRVELAERSYAITFGTGARCALEEDVRSFKSRKRRLAVLVDENVADLHKEALRAIFEGVPALTLPSGEGTKCFEQLERVCDFLAESKVDRGGAVFVAGGGVAGDLAGFAAASYLRGIALYQVPTTLLSMVDSSVGGKTGINLRAGKNLVGAFHQPSAVYIDSGFLETLPEREFRAGLAEVIKYGLLGDARLFEQIEALSEPLHAGHPDLPAIIRRNCAVKAAIVQADETEQAASGGRALLNLGHTFAHAIEAVAGYGLVLHGEAVAMGLVLAAELSVHQGFLPASEVTRIEAVLQRNSLPTRLPQGLSVRSLVEAMTRDKKVRDGALTFVLLREIGEAFTHSGLTAIDTSPLWLTRGALR